MSGQQFVMSDQQSEERSITIGYLKQLFERLKLPDDAVLFHNDGEWGWCPCGPEGEEIMFLTSEQSDAIQRKAKEEHHLCMAEIKLKYGVRSNGPSYHSFESEQFEIAKKETGQ